MTCLHDAPDICKYCKNIFTIELLLTHETTCISKYEFRINELNKQHEEEIEKLKTYYENKLDHLRSLAINNSVTNNGNNNNINNINITNNNIIYLTPINLEPDNIKNKVQSNFTKEHFLGGQEGVAEFTHKNLFNDTADDKYICGDISRNIYYYSDGDSVKKDVRASLVRNSIYNDILEKSREISIRCTEEIPTQMIHYADQLKEVVDLKLRPSKFLKYLSIIAGKKNPKSIIKTKHLDDDFIIFSDSENDYPLS